MLASDLNNPEFMNPQNPDSMLSVEFYWHEPEDVLKSEVEGKLVRLPKTPYVRIQRPGDMTSIIEVAVREDHKKRWPDRWLYWQMKEGLLDAGREVPGWPIEEWDFLQPEQVRDLKFKRFSVVEQIAGASDLQAQAIGMNGMGLREKAREALRQRMGSETRDALERKDRELAEMKERLERMEKILMTGASPAVKREIKDKYDDGKEFVASAPVAVTEPITEEQEREKLVAEYVEIFGTKPHHRASNDTIREQLKGKD